MSEKQISLCTLAIAFLAVVLSQLKPLHLYLESPEIKVEFGEHIKIGQKLGLAFFMPFLQITNSGEAPGYIKKIDLCIERKDQKHPVTILPAQQYYLKTSASSLQEFPTPVPISQLLLSEGENWSAFVEFFSSIDGAILDNLNSIQQAVTNQIIEKRRSSIENELFERIRQFSNSNLEWLEAGEYHMLLRIWDDKNSLATRVKLYQFNLTLDNLAVLNGVTARFRFGEFLVIPSRSQNGIAISLKNLSDQAKINDFKDRCNRITKS